MTCTALSVLSHAQVHQLGNIMLKLDRSWFFLTPNPAPGLVLAHAILPCSVLNHQEKFDFASEAKQEGPKLLQRGAPMQICGYPSSSKNADNLLLESGMQACSGCSDGAPCVRADCLWGGCARCRLKG